MKRIIISFLLTLFGGALCFAQAASDSVSLPAKDSTAAFTSPADLTVETLWDKANTAYVNNEFNTAAGLYSELLSRGVSSAKLFYNLGNACYKEDRIGQAILYYHRALRLAPGDDDIRYNLRVAESRTKDKIEAIPEFFAVTWMRDIRHIMGCTSWSLLSLVFLTCALGLFLVYLLASRLPLRKAGFYGTIIAVLLFMLASWFAFGDRCEMLDNGSAVVMSASTSVKSSPDKASTDLFILHEGTVVEVSSRMEGWSEITIADGKKGWVENQIIETI